jgi:hypothetical protein
VTVTCVLCLCVWALFSAIGGPRWTYTPQPGTRMTREGSPPFSGVSCEHTRYGSWACSELMIIWISINKAHWYFLYSPAISFFPFYVNIYTKTISSTLFFLQRIFLHTAAGPFSAVWCGYKPVSCLYNIRSWICARERRECTLLGDCLQQSTHSRVRAVNYSRDTAVYYRKDTAVYYRKTGQYIMKRTEQHIIERTEQYIAERQRSTL